MKKLIFSTILLLLSIIIVELFSATAIVFIWRKKHFSYLPTTQNMLSPMQQSRIQQIIDGQTQYVTHHQELGWSLRPHGDKILYTANNIGIRADTPTQKKHLASSKLIATFGDSFVHGDEVEFEVTWQEQMKQRNPKLEVLNFGVPGYGTDQAHLDYKINGMQWNPDIVILGFMSDNLKRNVNTFRPFYAPRTQFPMSKPRFEILADQLKLIPNPLPKPQSYQKLLDQQQDTLLQLSRNDYFYGFEYNSHPLDPSRTFRLLRILTLFYSNPRPPILVNHQINPSSEAWRVTAKILESFQQTARKNAAKPVFIIFPTYDELVRYHQKPEGPRGHQILLDLCERQQWHCLDMTDGLLNAIPNSHIESLFAPGRHYSAKGHAVVAETLLEFLQKKQLIP